MGDWKTDKLENCVDAIIDYRGKTPAKTSTGVPLITAKVVKNGRIETPNEFIAEDNYKSWMTRGYPKLGDVILTTEAPLGEVAQINNERIALAQRIILLRGKENYLDSTYLKYYLISDIGQAELSSRQTGTTVFGIKQSELRKIKVSFPSFDEQKAVAKILSSFDDKIELNRRMNATLEAMARALFKAWFVDFEPVHANKENRPSTSASPEIAKLFPSDFENNIPKGWGIGKVKDVCSVNKYSLNKTDDLKILKYIEISEVLRGVVNSASIYKRGEEPSRAKRKLSHGDIAISTVRPDRGAYFLAFRPEANLIASTGFAVFSAESVPFSFLYIFLTDDEQLTHYGKRADGAAYPAINQSVIMDLDIVVPPKDVLERFNSVVEPLFAKIASNFDESKSLSIIRDLLLPKLVSGKVILR